MIIPWSNKFLYFIISSAPLIESEPVEFVAQLVTIANNDRTLCALPAYNLNVRLSDLTFPAGRKLIYIVGQKEFFVVILILYSEISFKFPVYIVKQTRTKIIARVCFVYSNNCFIFVFRKSYLTA